MKSRSSWVHDEAGAVNAMVNRCAHRGNLVCIDEAGNAERLTCVYHNWTYDLRGNLASIAFERGIRGKGGMAEDFDRSRHGLHRLRVDIYRGLVFGTFSADAPPLAHYLGPEMRANIDRVLGREMEILGKFQHVLDGNWKLYIENVRDTYHATLLHSFFPTFGLNRLSMKGGIELSDGGLHHLTYSIGATDRPESQYNARELRAVKDGYSLNAPELLETCRNTSAARHSLSRAFSPTSPSSRFPTSSPFGCFSRKARTRACSSGGSWARSKTRPNSAPCGCASRT